MPEIINIVPKKNGEKVTIAAEVKVAFTMEFNTDSVQKAVQLLNESVPGRKIYSLDTDYQITIREILQGATVKYKANAK